VADLATTDMGLQHMPVKNRVQGRLVLPERRKVILETVSAPPIRAPKRFVGHVDEVAEFGAGDRVARGQIRSRLELPPVVGTPGWSGR
jgi:hypothetical protein